MTNDLLIILCGGVAAFTVYDLLKAAGVAGGWAHSGACQALAASSAMLGLHADEDLHPHGSDRVSHGAARDPDRPAGPAGLPSALVYLVGVLSPLFGLGLAVHPLI